MRLFIAIELNRQIQNTIIDIQNSLRRQGVRGNFTRPENLHLTLAFIGDYADPDYVLDALESVRFTPLRLTLDGFGNFGDLYWLDISPATEVSACAKRIRHALANADIPFDRKKFNPHITILRKGSFIIRPEIATPHTNMVVDHISLYRSDRGKSGMIYTELGRIDAG